MFKYNRKKVHKTNPSVADLVVFPEITTIFLSTETQLARLLEDLGLEQYYRKKISLRKILEIDEKTLIDEPGTQKSDLP